MSDYTSQKTLLVDHRLFFVEPTIINESIQKNNGTLIVKGTLQRANEVNNNGRVYPKEILVEQAKKYADVYVKERRAVGELDHPDSPVVSLQTVSHNILDMRWEGDDLIGTIEVLPTPCGNILKELFRSGITLGISSRGLGSLKPLSEGTVEVQDDYELIAWDFVSNPSTKRAFMRPVNEGVNKSILQSDPYMNVNRIITDILNVNF
jgi:hypothetical protein